MKDSAQIKTARKYGLHPGTLKCEAFALFDEGYSPVEVRFLLRRHKLTLATSFTGTIRRYYFTWKAWQHHDIDIKS